MDSLSFLRCRSENMLLLNSLFDGVAQDPSSFLFSTIADLSKVNEVHGLSDAGHYFLNPSFCTSFSNQQPWSKRCSFDQSSEEQNDDTLLDKSLTLHTQNKSACSLLSPTKNSIIRKRTHHGRRAPIITSTATSCGLINDRTFVCRICCACFRREEHLRRHTRTHNNQLPFECSACGQNFTRSDNMKGHMKRIHGIVVPNKRKH